MRIKADVFGCINDDKFSARGDGTVDPATGRATIRLTYSRIPQHWSPLNYSDPLVLLAGYREDQRGLNFLSLAQGGYSAVATIDFGAGLALRKTATINWEGDVVNAWYCLHGSARCPGLVSADPYEEYMHPDGDGKIIAVGSARWRTSGGEIIEALVSSRYTFTEHPNVLKVPQVRRFQVTSSVSADGLVFTGDYETSVTAL
jgi:hypothetical protein